jgi:hypothetical protein
MKFHGNPLNGSRDTDEKYFILNVQRPSLLTDRNLTYKVYSACVESERCDVSERKSLLEAEIETKSYFVHLFIIWTDLNKT